MKSEMLENLTRILESEEGKEQTRKYFERFNQKAAIEASQIERAYTKINHRFEEVVEKLLAKYYSDEYRDHWYNRGYEPPERLLYFLFYYAKKYGRELTQDEENLHSNTFTSEIYIVNNYVFNLMQGQGSAMVVSKLNEAINV